MAVVTNNASNNGAFLQLVEENLRQEKILFDVKNQHVRCMAHVINLAVQSFLQYLTASNTVNNNSDISDDIYTYEDNDDDDDDDDDDNNNYCDGGNIDLTKLIIPKLRKLIVKIRSSPQMRKRFALCCTTLEQKSKIVILDVKTRWNSTYDMIKRALELSEVSYIY